MAPAAGPSPFERRLARAGRDVRAVAILLEQACGLLRQLVCVTGWLVVLAATARLLVSPISALGTSPRPLPGRWPCSRASARRAGRRQRPADQPPHGDSQLTADQPAPTP